MLLLACIVLITLKSGQEDVALSGQNRLLGRAFIMKVSLLGQKYFCRNLLNFAKIGRISPNFGRNWPNFPDFGLFKKRPLSIYSLFKSFFEQLVAVLKNF